MHCGEITGQLYGATPTEIGMPIRSSVNTKREERKNRTIFDNNINDDATPLKNFGYFDPMQTQFGENMTEQQPFDNTISVKNTPLTQFRDNRFNDGSIMNISTTTIETINNFSSYIFDEISKKTCISFCVFPLGILGMIVENDPNIKKLLAMTKTNEIFHDIKLYPNSINSRATVIPIFDKKNITNKFGVYEDINTYAIELPLSDDKFAMGFIWDKHDNEISFTYKLLQGYIANMKHQNTNLICGPFHITNKLKLNSSLRNLGYKINRNVQYLQTIVVNDKKNAYVKASNVNPPIIVPDHCIFYVRNVPNNIIIFIGRRIPHEIIQ